MHENIAFITSAEIYRQKLQQSVSKGELSEDDVAALLRIRVLLCIPQETVDAAHADICGRLFEKASWIKFTAYLLYSFLIM